GPEARQVRDDVPVPEPGPGEVLVEVAAAGVNNTDIWTREGAYGAPGDPDALAGWRGVPITFPRIQGGEVVGRVVGTGTRVLVDGATYDGDGDDAHPVALLGSERAGGFAQYVAVPADRAHDVTPSPLPAGQLACPASTYYPPLRMPAH